MGFRTWSVVIAVCLFFGGMVQAQDIELELQMPGSMFGPGSPFSLDLVVTYTGPALNDAQLFVALTIGTGDFWFFPGWKHYPPEIDWDTVDVPASVSDTWEILPMFSWPSGAGAFEGAMFFAAILHNGVLMSNLADVTFGWTENPVPTSTPTQPAVTATPTSVPGTPTPTPSPPPGFVYIQPGTYTRGSPDGEPCRDIWEIQHQVTLTRGFYMKISEVSRLEWADLQAVQPDLPADPSDEAISPDDYHPVQRNTWFEAVLFSNLMSLQDGCTRCYYKDAEFTTPVTRVNYKSGSFYCNFNANGYRLPTEAEWEYACRAGTEVAFSCSVPNYYSDNCDSCTAGTHPTLEKYCVYCANSPGGTMMVGSKLPNPWGLYDVHGNVWEWCWDWRGAYSTGPKTDPTGPSTGEERLQRGGGWDNCARYCRSAYRGSDPPDYRRANRGFRLVRIRD